DALLLLSGDRDRAGWSKYESEVGGARGERISKKPRSAFRFVHAVSRLSRSCPVASNGKHPRRAKDEHTRVSCARGILVSQGPGCRIRVEDADRGGAVA